MKRLIVIVASLAITGCALTPTQKRVAGIVGSAIVIGAIAAHDSTHQQSPGPGIALTLPPGMPCTPQPNGTCR